MPNGKSFVVEADGNGPGREYIRPASHNGKPLERARRYRREVSQGGTLRLRMGPRPNKAWATAADIWPPQT